MKKKRPLILEKASLQYAPENELGVVYVFAHVAKRLQFRIELICAKYPECIARELQACRGFLVRYAKTKGSVVNKWIKAIWRPFGVTFLARA